MTKSSITCPICKHNSWGHGYELPGLQENHLQAKHPTKYQRLQVIKKEIQKLKDEAAKRYGIYLHFL